MKAVVLDCLLHVGLLLFALSSPLACKANGPLSGTYRSAPGSTAEYLYHIGVYETSTVPVDVTMAFGSGNTTSNLTAIIHKPIIGLNDDGEPIEAIATEFPIIVTGVSSNGRDFHGDLLGSQYLFDWRIEAKDADALILNGQVYWAGGRVEVTTIDRVILFPALSGDYNHDGRVDAADYVLWRKSFGETGVGLAADGNGNNEVDAGDYDVWRSDFGASVGGGAVGNAAVVPEPAGFGASIAAVATMWCGASARRRRRG